ncbi:siderophore biosynthesis lipase/esterase [Apiospora kogelbergensis]|uniref:siderophore biosynthesis lipase/esterase n=1 Tax=Apiospora kogelbergensis TaxID=1337665 RepID=UPI00312FD88F
MNPMSWAKRGLPGILHHYTETLVTFEYTSQAASQPHSVLFVGGLSDGLATTSYTADIISALQPTAWSFFTLVLTSSYQGWGLSDLDRDTEEIAQCLRYIQNYKASRFGEGGKLVLMGHSTGSQCILHYLHRPNPHPGPLRGFDSGLCHENRCVLDGAIMQAPVSDREAIQSVLEDGLGDHTAGECREAYDTLVKLATEALASPGSETQFAVLPIALTSRLGLGNQTPVGARRFLSLASPNSPQQPGPDDLFSSDLSDEQLAATFGAVAGRGLLRYKLMVAPSGEGPVGACLGGPGA